MWLSFLAMAYKEYLHLSRNKMLLKVIVRLQIVQLVGLSFLDLTARNVPTVIVDQDHSSYSRDFQEKVRATGVFSVNYVTSSVAQARDHLRAGRARVGVIIPPDFAQTRVRSSNAHIMTLIDGSDPGTSSQAAAAISGVAGEMGASADMERLDGPSIRAHSILLFNPEGRAPLFMLPGLLAILMYMNYTSNVAQALLREREAGNLDRLLMTPVNYVGLVAGKAAPYVAAGIINCLAVLALLRFVFTVPIRGGLIGLVAGAVLYMLTLVSFAQWIGATSMNAQHAQGRSQSLTFPAVLLSGYFFPLSAVPWWLLPVSYALPTTHFIEIVRGTMLRGATMMDLLPHFLYLVTAPVVFFGMALRGFRKYMT